MPTSRSKAPEPAHKDPAPVAGSPLSWFWPWFWNGVTWVCYFAIPMLTLAYLTGLSHWVTMYAYDTLGCHRVSLIGFLWSSFDQARPECVLLWRIANLAHWSIFGLFGQVLQHLVPSA